MPRDQVSPLAIIGAGKLGEILLSAVLQAGLCSPGALRATARRADRIERLGREYGVVAGADNAAAVSDARVVVVAVKPHNMEEVLPPLSGRIPDDAVVVSVAAGVTLQALEEWLPAARWIRAMPNTPARVGAGMTVLSPGGRATEADLATARRLFDAVGRTRVLAERHLDAVTGLSASGPAFMYVVMESLAEGGVKAGLPRSVATELVAQAMFGASKLALETGAHPALLKDEVTTPAGCTIDGLLELEAGGLRVALINAIVTAARRAGELG